ncbi:hypothetical protein QQM79_06540 [Marinobacteraceae bacterium S3BR75-40.1]
MRKVIQSNQETVFIPPLDEPAREAPVQRSARFRVLRQRIKAVLKRWLERQVQRHRLRVQLYEMNTDAVERDIGVPRGTLAQEAHKPFWRE